AETFKELSETERVARVASELGNEDEILKIAYRVDGLDLETAGELKAAICRLVAKAMITQHNYEAFTRGECELRLAVPPGAGGEDNEGEQQELGLSPERRTHA